MSACDFHSHDSRGALDFAETIQYFMAFSCGVSKETIPAAGHLAIRLDFALQQAGKFFIVAPES
jgi:hypothetical protein